MIARLRGSASRHPVLAAVGLALTATLLAAPFAHADIWANVGPASSLAGLKGGPPLGHYDLDQQFSMISVGVFSGVDASGVLPMVAYFAATEIWRLTAWMANILIELFGLAFSLDLVNGSSATGGAGALAPVSRAISSIYSSVLGGPWMVLAFSAVGFWAMWKALIQRRYAETAGQLALSLAYIGIAFLFVLQPARTIGAASHWTNEMSGAFLSIAKDGEPASEGEAKEAGADQLFGLLVAQPWAVLEFGGLDHCVASGSGSEEPGSVAVEPLPEGARRRLDAGEQVSPGGKTCINNIKKYGPHLLRFEQGSKERSQEVEALIAGESSKLPDADPGKEDGSYELGPADRPAGAAMEKAGQYERAGVAFLVLIAELGAFCLLGALSVGIITAQVLLLLLLAFSPVALVAAAIPGRGHRFFRAWLAKLAGYLLRKAAYSLVLAILLTVCAAISTATSELGWLFSFGLQCAFFWAVFLQRRSLTEGLIGIVTGPTAPGRDRALDVLGLYYGARLAGGATRPVRRAAKGAGRSALWLGGRFLGRGRPGPLGPRRVPFGGRRESIDLGGRHGGGGQAGPGGGGGPTGPAGGGGEPTGPAGGAGGPTGPGGQGGGPTSSGGGGSEATGPGGGGREATASGAGGEPTAPAGTGPTGPGGGAGGPTGHGGGGTGPTARGGGGPTSPRGGSGPSAPAGAGPTGPGGGGAGEPARRTGGGGSGGQGTVGAVGAAAQGVARGPVRSSRASSPSEGAPEQSTGDRDGGAGRRGFGKADGPTAAPPTVSSGAGAGRSGPAAPRPAGDDPDGPWRRPIGLDAELQADHERLRRRRAAGPREEGRPASGRQEPRDRPDPGDGQGRGPRDGSGRAGTEGGE